MTFTFTVTAADWGRVAPELVMAVMTLIVMLVDLLLPRSGASAKDSGPTNFVVLPLLCLLGIAGAFAATIILFVAGDQRAAFNNMIGSDYGSLYAYIIILSASALGILLSPSYLKRLNLVHQGEYYALYLLATLGMLLMSAALNFLVIFLGLEMLSLALYILCGFVTRRIGSQEAGMKYFLLSSFASAILLYGIALTYGSTGSTTFINVRAFLSLATNPTIKSLTSTGFPTHTLLLVAMGLMVVGFAFKVSAIPFQAWTPDVYDGAPAPVTAFMSVGTKAAAIIAFARVFDIVLGPVISDWQPIIWAIAVLTIVGGNIMALVQTNTKRLLAYSSIAHAGYLLIGVVVGGTVGIAAILFYLLCYTFMNLGAFGVVSILEHVDNTGSNYSDIRGLWYRQPILAGTLAIFLLALAGFPPMSGFAAKYYIFYAALQGGHPELLIIGVLASVLGMYYYLRVIATMFMEKEPVATMASATNASTTGNLSTGKRNSTKLSRDAMVAPTKGGTAVAVKPKTTAAIQPKTVVPTVKAQSSNGNWFTWVALGAALIGTFAMGTVLPFWLVQLAQQAAGMMMSLR
ncbi:MAG: NADH-quinone oxidoreductase subunit N [Ktedonobacteraceae bacterium]